MIRLISHERKMLPGLIAKIYWLLSDVKGKNVE